MSVSKQIAVFITQIFFCAVCCAQMEKIDSLKKVLPSLHDRARANCLYWLTQAYFSENIDSSRHYVAEEYSTALKINDSNDIGMSLINFALIAFITDDYSSAEKYYQKAASLFERIHNYNLAGMNLLGVGNTHWYRSNFHAAIDAYKNAISHFQKINDSVMLGKANELIGIIYMEQGNYEKSFEFNLKALTIRKDINDTLGIAASLTYMGSLYNAIGDYNTSMNYYQQSLLYARPEQIPGNLYIFFGELYNNLNQYDSAIYFFQQAALVNSEDTLRADIRIGETFLLQKKYDKALNIFLKYPNLLKQRDEGNEQMKVLLDIGKAYAGMQEYKNALPYAKKGLALSKEKGALQKVRDGYQLLSYIWEHLQKPDSAIVYYRFYVTMKDSIINDQIRGKLFELKRIAEDEKRLAQIDLLKKEKKLQEYQIQEEELLRNIIISALMIILVVVMLVIRNIRLKRRKEQLQYLMTEANTQLENRKKEQQLAELEMQVLRAQMNPHFVFNILNTIESYALENNKEAVSVMIQKFSRLTRLVLENSTNQLVPFENDWKSLQLYVELEQMRFADKFLVAYKVQEQILKQDYSIPPMIIQPFIENAIIHGLRNKPGNGGILNLSASLNNGYIIVLVEDNGIGRAKAALLKANNPIHKNSLGIKVTQDRISMFNNLNQDKKAKVEIQDLHEGTRVLIRLPATNSL